MNKVTKKQMLGSECTWANKIGKKTKGVYLGVKGSSGRQAIFQPYGSTKPIYIDVTQLSF